MTICASSISISPPIPSPSIFSAEVGRFLHPCPAAAKGAHARAAQSPKTGEEKERAETCRVLKKTGWENYSILSVSEQIYKPKNPIYSEIKGVKDKALMHKNLDLYLLQLQLTESFGYRGSRLKRREKVENLGLLCPTTACMLKHLSLLQANKSINFFL